MSLQLQLGTFFVMEEETMEMRIDDVLERALLENRISRQEWESILDIATIEYEAILSVEKDSLMRLVTLLEGGVVQVEGVPQTEILRRLSVFV